MGLWVWRSRTGLWGSGTGRGLAGQHCKVHVLLPLLVLNIQLGDRECECI